MAFHGRTAFDELLYRLGHLLADLEHGLPGKAGAAPPAAARRDGLDEPEWLDEDDLEDELDDDFDLSDEAVAAVTSAAGAWAASRLLRPHGVSWTRVALAGIAATALYELARAAEGRLRAEDLEPDELATRVGSGIATAALYASLLYPRLPGPPLLRGLSFGALEAATEEAGGTAALLRRLSPQVRTPLSSLLVSTGEPAGPLPHLAFGLGLGLLYRSDEEE